MFVIYIFFLFSIRDLIKHFYLYNMKSIMMVFVLCTLISWGGGRGRIHFLHPLVPFSSRNPAYDSLWDIDMQYCISYTQLRSISIYHNSTRWTETGYDKFITAPRLSYRIIFKSRKGKYSDLNHLRYRTEKKEIQYDSYILYLISVRHWYNLLHVKGL